ncbi:hypothetical protein [Natrononativus amylolyticus]|uniref:hypothetical protein n=1 Tax=Natrononativus amylolyticus TaxID=2963434 RepID=UPI0020CEF389|nr:hypothetical protein [Natrononativus amylolyticus]
MTERTVRHKADGPRGYSGRDIRTRPGDTASVDADDAEYLVDEAGYFEYVDDQDTVDTDTESADEPGADSTAFVDRTPMTDIIDDIAAGDADDHLDAIETAERNGRDRNGVVNAIEERRAVLES